MSNYRRLISYIYAYEGGVKGKNIGFAKIETRGTQLKITVSVKKVYVGGNDVGVYLLAQDAEIYLGNIFIRGGSGEFRTVVSASDVERSGINAEQCYGLTVHDVKNTWRSYTTIWEDAVAHAAEVDLAGAALKPAEPGVLNLSEAMIKRAVKEIEEEFPLPPLKPEEAVVARENEDKEKEDVNYQQSKELVGARQGESSSAGPVIGDRNMEQEPTKPYKRQTEQRNMESSDSGPLDINQPKMEQPIGNGTEIDFSRYIQTNTGWELMQEAQEQPSLRQQRSIDGQAFIEPLRGPQNVEAEQQPEERQVKITGQQNKEGVIEAAEQQAKEGDVEAAWQQASRGGMEAAEQQSKQGSIEASWQQASQGGIEVTEQQASQGTIEAAERYGNQNDNRISEQQVNQSGKDAVKQQNNQDSMVSPEPQADQRTAAAVHQAKVTTIEAMRQQTKEGPIKSWEQQAQAGTMNMFPQQSKDRQMESLTAQTELRQTDGTDVQMAGRQESTARPRAQTDGLQFSQAQSPAESESRIPDRTICYRADAVMQDERNPGNPGASQAAYGEMASVQSSRQNDSSGESSQKASSIKLTDPEELERLSKLEEEEEGSHDRVWERLKREHTRILAFDYEKGCEILTIKPQDIGLLPREEWVYGNNSFLLHGYYNYRYLILARLHNPEGAPRYLLGVPGHYYSNERYMASMFGFPNFVLSKEQPVGDGRFGYWYTDVKLGD